jgi:hypothetical protein
MSGRNPLLSFRVLKALSFTHSAIYAALLFCWLAPGLKAETRVFGWAHGVMWIGMSILVIVASRRRIIPFWLAVVVVVVGGVGPFAGSWGFVVAERRGQVGGASDPAPAKR